MIRPDDFVEVPEKFWPKGTSGCGIDLATLRAAAEARNRHPFDHNMEVKAYAILWLLDQVTHEYDCDCDDCLITKAMEGKS